MFHDQITPPMSAARAREIATAFDLRALPADFLANPYPVYAVLREHEPVRHMPDGSVFLTRYADLVAVYRDAATFSSDKHVEFAPKYGVESALYEHHTTSLVFNDPPLHTRVRKLIMGALTRRAIADMEPGLVTLVAERRKNPGDPEHDVLTRLIQGEDLKSPDGSVAGETLSETELLQNCVFILNAGHETTTNLIGNALVALQEWPGARAHLLSKVKLSAQDAQGTEADLSVEIDEFLRFESSNQLGNRRALKACQVGGVDLPEGALLTLCIGAANRDPAQFDHPEQLDLTRENNRHLAFGFGIHQCAGLSLARLEGRIAVGRFLQRFPDYRLTAAPTRGGRARFRGFLNAPFEVGSA